MSDHVAYGLCNACRTRTERFGGPDPIYAEPCFCGGTTGFFLTRKDAENWVKNIETLIIQRNGNDHLEKCQTWLDLLHCRLISHPELIQALKSKLERFLAHISQPEYQFFEEDHIWHKNHDGYSEYKMIGCLEFGI